MQQSHCPCSGRWIQWVSTQCAVFYKSANIYSNRAISIFVDRQRGDGFPLANMLALVSVENKDINPILAAHIYTVCPVAIPALPTPSKDASEDEFMESLGMLREKSGEFETFEKFLSRTEVRSPASSSTKVPW